MGQLFAPFGISELPLEVRRSRESSGAVSILIRTDQSDLKVPCDTFMTKLDLPGCPEKIETQFDSVRISGIGAGHKRGLELTTAAAEARAGASAEEILRGAYGGG